MPSMARYMPAMKGVSSNNSSMREVCCGTEATSRCCLVRFGSGRNPGALFTACGRTDSAAPAVADPCSDAWAHQQVAKPFTPSSASANGVSNFESLLAVGTRDDGLCLATTTELHDSSWAISSIVLSATGRGQDGLSVTFTRTGTDRNEDLNVLYVPLRGCVRVTGRITATHSRGSATSPAAATWMATGWYGRGCPQAPNRGAYQTETAMSP